MQGYEHIEPNVSVLKIHYDGQRQVVKVVFDVAEFKTWDFVLAVLAMATEDARMRRTMSVAQSMQAAQAQALQDQAIRGKLNLG